MPTINYETKEQLRTEYEKALKEFDKPKWEIRMVDNGYIMLYNDKNFECKLVEDKNYWKKYFVKDFSELIFTMANVMGYIATPEQMLDYYKKKYQISLDNLDLKFEDLAVDRFVCGSCIIDTKEHAEEIKKLLNNSPDIKKWLEFCKGDK